MFWRLVFPTLPALPSSTGEVSGDLYPLGLGEYQLIRRFAFGCYHILTVVGSQQMASLVLAIRSHKIL